MITGSWGPGKGEWMTIEEQRYLEECKKVLKQEQTQIVKMAFDYGLQIPEIRRLVQSNQSAECMKEIVFAMMEGISGEVLDFLCENAFNPYQIKEIREGIARGLSFEQVRSYAVQEMSANKMKKMRTQLEETVKEKNGAKDDGSVKEYMKNLMQIMEDSIRQFKESNERFDILSSLVKEHVVEEKNQEIQDLYENLKHKDKSIQELQRKIEERDKTIADLEKALSDKKAEEQKPPVVSAKSEDKKDEILLEAGVRTEQGKQTLKKRMFGWFALRDHKIPKDVLEKIMEADLSTEQLEEVRKCMESGLNDQEISRVIANNPSPERMQKLREILLLIRSRREGA